MNIDYFPFQRRTRFLRGIDYVARNRLAKASVILLRYFPYFSCWTFFLSAISKAAPFPDIKMSLQLFAPTETSLDGRPCNGQSYSAVAGDCNAYLHCDGSVWRKQRCAPGLHWSASENHCDWPSYAKCQSELLYLTLSFQAH